MSFCSKHNSCFAKISSTAIKQGKKWTTRREVVPKRGSAMWNFVSMTNKWKYYFMNHRQKLALTVENTWNFRLYTDFPLGVVFTTLMQHHKDHNIWASPFQLLQLCHSNSQPHHLNSSVRHKFTLAYILLILANVSEYSVISICH